jgi:erythromycin esterase-like protein
MHRQRTEDSCRDLRSSIAAVLAYLDRVDPPAADQARRRYGCLTPW